VDGNNNTPGLRKREMSNSYRLIHAEWQDDLDAARFPTLEQAKEVETATEFGGDGYFAPRVVESDDEPNTTATEFITAAWPDYPGPVPAGVDPADWFAQENA
jgi:hypothetical protein